MRNDEEDGTVVTREVGLHELALHSTGVNHVTRQTEIHYTDRHVTFGVMQDVERDDPGVVIVIRDKDGSVAASVDLGRDEGAGHHVDSLGGASRPDQAVRVAGADEAGDDRPGFLEHLGGAAGLFVRVAAAGVGVVAGHEVANLPDDLGRLLARRPRIQPGGLWVLGEEREIGLGVARTRDGSGNDAEAGVAREIGVRVLISGVHFRDSLSWFFGVVSPNGQQTS